MVTCSNYVYVMPPSLRHQSFDRSILRKLVGYEQNATGQYTTLPVYVRIYVLCAGAREHLSEYGLCC